MTTTDNKPTWTPEREAEIRERCVNATPESESDRRLCEYTEGVRQ